MTFVTLMRYQGFMNHEGKLLEIALAEVGITHREFARRCKVTPTSVSRYIHSSQFSSEGWSWIRRGLTALRLDPRKIRPEDSGFIAPQIEFKSFFSNFNVEQLKLLVDLLKVDEETRDKAATWLEGAINFSSK